MLKCNDMCKQCVLKRGGCLLYKYVTTILSGATTGRLSSATTRVADTTETDEGQSVFVLGRFPCPNPHDSIKILLISVPKTFGERRISSMKITRTVITVPHFFVL
jgi:hypothetical protein